MAAFFFESSAFVKRYAKETGTSFVVGLFKPSRHHQLYAAQVTFVEVISAIARRHRGGSLGIDEYTKAVSRFRRVFARRVYAVNIDEPLLEKAAQFAEKHFLRGYDAVQLAAALDVQQVRNLIGASPLTLVSADVDLNNAALAEGLLVDNPNLHP